MARQDNTPGQNPLTRGLQIFSAVTSKFVNANSGQAFFETDDVWVKCRLDPQLISGKLVAVQIQLKSAAILEYSSGNESGVAGEVPTADNGGLATLEVQTFYQPIWLGNGEFLMRTATAATVVHYMLILRARTKQEEEAGE